MKFMQSSAKFRFIICILLITAIGTIVYGNTFKSPFVFDDLQTIVETEGGKGSRENLRDFTDFSAIFNAHPLRVITYFSLAVNYHFGELHTFGYHLFNTLFHVFTALGIFFLFFYTLKLYGSKSFPIPFLASIIFSVLPIHTEAVTYIISRATILNAFFLILGLYSFIVACYLAKDKLTKRSLLLFFLTLILFPVSILSKEIGVIFPVMVVAFDYFFLKNSPLRYRLLCFYLPLIIVFAVFGVRYYGIFNNYIAHNPSLKFRGLSANMFLQCNIIPFITKTLCLPINLNLDYDFIAAPTQFSPRVVVILLSFIIFLFLFWKIGSPIVFFFLLWSIITLLPTNSLLPRPVPLSDHNLYLPSMGLCFIFSYALHGLKRKLGSFTILGPLALLTCLFFSSLTIDRNHTYQNSATLWRNTASKSPYKPRTHVNLGNALMALGEVDEAIIHYSMALRLFPGLPAVHNNLGAVFSKKGMLDVAIYHFTNAIKFDTEYGEAYKNLGITYGQKGMLEEAVENLRKAIEINPNYAEAHHDLGTALAGLGKTDEAISHYAKALEIKPNFDVGHYSLGSLLDREGRTDEAIHHFLEALRINPAYAEAHNNLGILYNKKGLKLEALAHFHKALKIQPDYAKFHNNLGILFLGENKLPEAAGHFNRSLRIGPNNPETLFYLGTVFLKEGNFDAASYHLQEALRIYPDYAEAHFNLGNLLTQQGKPEEAEAHFAMAARIKPEMDKSRIFVQPPSQKDTK